jgi:hypothetical protein
MKLLPVLRMRIPKLIPAALFIFFSLVSLSLSAQRFRERQIFQEDHDSKPYYFGITLSTGLAYFHTEKHAYFIQQDSVFTAEPLNSPAFALGLAGTVRLTNRFETRFNPVLMFTDRSITYELKYSELDKGTTVTQRIESIIVSFPLQLKFNSDRIGNFRVYMLGGAKLDLDLASNARARKVEDQVKINKLDHGYEAGIGFNFYFPSFIFSPELKIGNGINNIHSRDEKLKYSNILDRIQSRMIVFSIHLEG